MTSALGAYAHPVRGHLVNIIPGSRRWSLLHFAVLQNDASAVRRLLQYRDCDTLIRTKESSAAFGDASGLSAVELALEFDFPLVVDMLCRHVSLPRPDPPTFQPYDQYDENKEMSLISVTLAANKNAFHPKPMDPTKSLNKVLSDIFYDVCTSDVRWIAIQDVVADSVYTVSLEKSEELNRCKSREQFFSRVVRTYTNENNAIYSYLNMAFCRQSQNHYRPNADDMAMGPYAVMYQTLLMFWKALGRETKTTYRKMLMTIRDMEKYTVGTRFVWHSIVSSALERQKIQAFPTSGPSGDYVVIFTIDNRAPCLWQPRNIEAHAQYQESERTYPAGARFQVTRRFVVNGETHIHLKLLGM